MNIAEMCSKAVMHFVLIHGAGHGAWCWFKMQTLLEAAGYKVTCLDLKCSGIDPSDYNTVFSFDHYNQPLTDLISSLPPNQKVILVGHSAGGLSLTDMIHKFPKKIHMAVYVAANMLKYGYVVSTNKDEKDPEEPSNVYDIIYGLGADQPPTGVMVKPQLRRKLLYNMSPIEDSNLASMLLRVAPARALNNARFVEGKGSDSVARVFIRTLNDQLFKQDKQDAMINQWPPSKVHAINTDHSPFFSAPNLLFGVLVEAMASLIAI